MLREVVIALALVTSIACTDTAQPSQLEDLEAEGAEPYARAFSLDIHEAVRRLRLQDEAPAAINSLRTEFAPRLAGLFYQHEPDFRLVLRLIGGQRVNDRIVELPSGALHVSFIVGAAASYDELKLAAQSHDLQLLAKFPEIQSVSADQRTGKILIRIRSAQEHHAGWQNRKADFETTLGHPVELQFLDPQSHVF